MWKTARSDAGRMLHDIDVRDGMVYASYWNDGLVMLDIGSGIKGGSPSNPQLVSQYKYDLDALYKPVEAVGGPGFIRGTHTAWRHEQVRVHRRRSVHDEGHHGARDEGREPSVWPAAGARRERHLSSEVGRVVRAGDTAAFTTSGWRATRCTWARTTPGSARSTSPVSCAATCARSSERSRNVNPSDPKGFVPNNTMTWGVVVKNGLAYINDVNNGLFIVRIEPKAAIVP